MKLHIITSFVALCAILSYAQWEPDVRLTNNPAWSYTSDNNAWCIASSGEIIHVVWFDNRDENYEIYYKRSTDSGVNWGADTWLTVDGAYSEEPSVAASGLVVHVVWFDNRDGNNEIYYKRSTDSGVNWGSDTRLTINTAYSLNPSVAVSNLVVHVVWFDNRDGNYEIYYKRSTNSGLNWGVDTRLTNSSNGSGSPSVAVSGSVVHVVWEDNRDGNVEIYYKRSTDGGVNWTSDTRLTIDAALSNSPSVAVSGSLVHVVWHDARDGNDEIYYKRSTDSGVNWGIDTRLTIDDVWSNSPSVAVSGSVVHVVWDGSEVQGWEDIWYKRSTDGGVNWSTDTLNKDASHSEHPSVATSGSVVHVVWQDNRHFDWEIYYKRNPTGNPTGIENINSEVPEEFRLYQNYPNPFNPITKISWQSPAGSWQTLKIFDVLGNEVATLVDEYKPAGTYEVEFNVSSLSSSVSAKGGYASGVYFYQLKAGEFFSTKKMVLLK